jgi:diguanylate cyclase (GGDEF)-like protein
MNDPRDVPQSAIKDPDDWVTGDEPMTGAQESYLGTLSREAGEEPPTGLSKAEAAKRIEELIDVDKFKDINDRYSHGIGDRVLAQVADLIRAHCRQLDVPVRFGGDEFAVFLHADLATTARIAERIRRSVGGHRWHDIAPALRVTVSMGAASLPEGMAARQLFDAADRQLYAAKHRGRDQVAA